MAAITDPQLEAFAQHYAIYKHSRKAREHAGFDLATTSPHAILNLKVVKNRIQELWNEAAEEVGVTPQRVLQEISRVAFASIRDIYDDQGNPIPMHELDDDTAATIVGVDIETKWERDSPASDNVSPVVTKKIRRADKMAALSILAKHVKIIGDDSDGVNALASALADRLKAARKRVFAQDAQEAEDARIIERPSQLGAPITQQESDDEILW